MKARRDTPGPPFDFVAQDFRGDNEPRLLLTSTLLLRQPDLPGQLELEPGSASDDERHTDYSEGWRGPWVRDLISSQESGQSLGEITVQEKRGGWGLVLKLEVSALPANSQTLKMPTGDMYASERIAAEKHSQLCARI